MDRPNPQAMAFRWLAVWPALACFAVFGCSPAAPPATAPGAHARHDHGHADDHDAKDHDAKDADSHDHGHDHDHDDADDDHRHPETMAAAIAELEELCSATRAALAAGDTKRADGPVHMVGHLLEDMARLVAKAKPADPDLQAAAGKAIEEIFDCFDRIDTAIHDTDEDAARKVDYADHAPRIEAATAKLKEIAK